MTLNPEDLLKSVYIPPQPQLINDLQVAGTDLERISDLISTDPTLSALVLKTINSPFFGLKSRIASIHQAVILMGIERVINLVKTVMLTQSFDQQNVSIDMDEFWQTSSAVAVVSSAVCRQLNLSLTDEAYSLGLFHNTGLPMIAQRVDGYADIIKMSYAREDAGITREEFKQIGMHHAAAGYRLSRVWNLPMMISEAVKHHHSALRILDDNTDENPELKSLISVLKISEHIVKVYQRLGGAEVDHEWNSVKASVLGFLGLSEYDLEDLEDAITYTLGSIP